MSNLKITPKVESAVLNLADLKSIKQMTRKFLASLGVIGLAVTVVGLFLYSESGHGRVATAYAKNVVASISDSELRTLSVQDAVAPISQETVIGTALAEISKVETAQAQAVMPPIDVWWPTETTAISGTQPFKAMLQGKSVAEYTMTWQVDDDALHTMPDNYTDWPHKEDMVDLSGWTWKGSGPYKVTFTAKGIDGSVIAKRDVYITVGSGPALGAPQQSPEPKIPGQNELPAAVASKKTKAKNKAINKANPFRGMKLWVNPNSDPQKWVDSHRGDPNVPLMEKIAKQPDVNWYGNWNSDVKKDVNERVTAITNAGALPVIVAYNIPQRDCGGYSAGGSNSPDAYKQWIRQFAAGIGNRNAMVILEPDALTMSDCLSPQDKQTRFNLLKEAVDVLNGLGNTYVYIDIGHAAWKSADDAAYLLKQAGIEKAQGFSLNISNFQTNEATIAYGKNISSKIGGKHFVFDTGRNGAGPAPGNEWCNPIGRVLGSKPTTNTGQALVDAYLWVRGPSGSDGTCNGGPAAGQFWPEYGLGLARNTAWK